jgi:hypothetical protein
MEENAAKEMEFATPIVNETILFAEMALRILALMSMKSVTMPIIRLRHQKIALIPSNMSVQALAKIKVGGVAMDS